MAGVEVVAVEQRGARRRQVRYGRSGVEVVVRREEDGVDEASRRVCQACGHVVDEGTQIGRASCRERVSSPV